MDKEKEVTKSEEVKKEDVIEIPIDDVVFNDFEKHLNIEGNQRILFSGKFGVGKTYFLKKFFEKHNEEYEVVHLYPVNYQISSNEDILDLIKYDILIELLKKDKDIFKTNKLEDFIDLRNLVHVWASENRGDIIKTVLSNIPKLGKSMNDAYLLVEKFSEFKDKFEGDEKLVVEDFLNSVNAKSKEADKLSGLIKEKISIIANKDNNGEESKKESVLILDDLDRLDPEHIFRILNVFSAFFEQNGEENKFGFDKIILVADYGNLKSIFHHKYGKDTDWKGYFNKFFSVGVHYFDFDRIIRSAMDSVALKIKISKRDENSALDDTDKKYVALLVANILLEMVRHKEVNMKDILKLHKFDLESLNGKGNGYDDEKKFLIDLALDILLHMSSQSRGELLEKIEFIGDNLENSDRGMYNCEEYISDLVIMKDPSLRHKKVGDKIETCGLVLKREGVIMGQLFSVIDSNGVKEKALYQLIAGHLKGK
ncbi:P-loop NTPase fold protein [Patescibacteria group bacterium]